MHTKTLADWLAHEPYTLCLSAGFFGFFAHTGLLKALQDADLLPARLVGASAGGLVAVAWAAGVETDALCDELTSLRREDFWDPRPGLGLLRGHLFEAKLRGLLPVDRFEEARVPCAVSVHNTFRHRTESRRTGSLVEAIRTTCALPGLFQPVWRNGTPYLDGGILDRPGFENLADGERVFFHHLPSKSPWRRETSAALFPKLAPNMQMLAIHDLPRANPFRLDAGRRAMSAAYEATRRALSATLEFAPPPPELATPSLAGAGHPLHVWT